MNRTASAQDLSKLFPVDAAENVVDEVLEILRRISPDLVTAPVCNAFEAAQRLYQGNFPGYKACNTGYHDFRHASEAFLAMSRLIHGAILRNESFSESEITTALVATLLHDAGYIQEKSDTRGTGAKYKAIHEQRSMDFLSRHGFELGLSEAQIDAGRLIILCTDMDADISAIDFPSPQIEMLGKLLGTGDLMSQLAERTYLEKLLYLYYECKEAGVDEYKNELDILYKAIHFYDFFEKRLRTTLGGVDRFMRPHFASRWGIDRDLYHEAIQRQRDYLTKVLKIPDADPRDYLRRGGIIKNIRETYHQNKPKQP
jgi:hypothetical protein